MLKILGYFFLGLPFVGLFIFFLVTVGLRATLEVFGLGGLILSSVAGCVFMGFYLIELANKKGAEVAKK